MTELNERFRGIDRLTPPDLWEAAQARAEGDQIQADLPTDRRIAVIALSLAIGFVAVAWVVLAIRPTAPSVPAEQPILSPAPRSDCPTELPRGESIGTQEFVREMQGYLPTWLPQGFGLMAMGGWDGAIDGSAGQGTWVDERCRMVTVTFNPNWRASDPGSPVEPNEPQVGPWSVVADAPDECSNAILGPARCLEYQAASGEGSISLQMMGLDRSEGDRVALSIYSGEPVYFPTAESGPLQMQALFEGSLIERDGCVFMDGDEQVSLPIWPEGFSVDRGEQGALQIHAEDRKIVTVVGEPMSMGGGYIAEFFPPDEVDPRDEQIASVEDRLGLAIPTRCLGPDVYGFWLVGSIADDPDSPASPTPEEPDGPESVRVQVPILEGLTLNEAKTVLASIGLGVAPVYLANDSEEHGTVTGLEPEPGKRVGAATSVIVYVSAGPDGGGFTWAGSIVKQNLDVFLGSYRGRDSFPVLAIGPDADLPEWQAELEATSEGRMFELVQCPVGPESLREVAREVRHLVEDGMIERGTGFGMDPRTCSVQIEGSFAADELQLLRDRYGSLLTIVDGISFARLL